MFAGQHLWSNFPLLARSRVKQNIAVNVGGGHDRYIPKGSVD